MTELRRVCHNCDGDGTVEIPAPGGDIEVPCPVCDESGYLPTTIEITDLSDALDDIASAIADVATAVADVADKCDDILEALE